MVSSTEKIVNGFSISSVAKMPRFGCVVLKNWEKLMSVDDTIFGW